MSPSDEKRVEAVFVGTELLDGKLNTHAALLSKELAGIGLTLSRETTVGDSVEEIAEAVQSALGRARAVVMGGGLGPTFDDLTREGAARALGRGLVFRPALLKEIRRKFESRGLRMEAENRRQAYLVRGGRALPNAQGSAPGQLIRAAGPDGRPRLLALLPGPTHEFAPMLRSLVLPELKRELGARPVPRLDLHVAGLMEASVDEAVRPVLKRHKDLRATILGGWGLVHLHFGAERAAALEDVRRTLKRSLAGHLYGEGAATLASASLERLLRRGESLATAESCTGGLIAKDLTDVPGSSRSFVGGLVAYDNALKTAELGVSPALIRRYGAVSGHCAKAMAAGARRRYRADWGLAATGVAGPGGGTRAKPVGRVWLAVAGPRRVQALRFDFAGDRDAVRRRAATLALYLLWKELGRR